MKPNPSLPNDPNVIPPRPKSDRFNNAVAWVCGPSVVFAVAFALANAAGVKLSRIPEKNYSSTGRFLVGGARAIPKLENGDPIPDSFYATSVEILQSSEVLTGAHARALNSHRTIIIQPQPCKVEASRLPGTNIIVVRATAREPTYVQIYLDAVMDEFLEVRQRMNQWISTDISSGLYRFGWDIRSVLAERVAELEVTIKHAEQWISMDTSSRLYRLGWDIRSVLAERVAELEVTIKDAEQGIFPRLDLENLRASLIRITDLRNRMDYPMGMFFPHPYEVFKIIEHATPGLELKPAFSIWNIFK